MYPTKALGVTSSIWFCSKRLKEKWKIIVFKSLTTYLLFAGGRVVLPENSVIIIISGPSITKLVFLVILVFWNQKDQINSNIFFPKGHWNCDLKRVLCLMKWPSEMLQKYGKFRCISLKSNFHLNWHWEMKSSYFPQTFEFWSSDSAWNDHIKIQGGSV